jgi:hypothetical protein
VILALAAKAILRATFHWRVESIKSLCLHCGMIEKIVNEDEQDLRTLYQIYNNYHYKKIWNSRGLDHFLCDETGKTNLVKGTSVSNDKARVMNPNKLKYRKDTNNFEALVTL